jgi:MFS family permease
VTPVRRLRRPTAGLASQPDFLRLWTGQSISELGSQVSQLAIPWVAAFALHANPLEFSLLGVAGFLPFILFALPAGVWVDQLRRRQVLIVADAARALLLALVTLLWAIGALRIWHLLALQFVVGVFTVFFDVAYQSYLPSLVDRKQLVEGNSKLQLTSSIAQVAGPSMSGGLIAAVTAPYAVLVDAASFVASAVFMLGIRHREEIPERTPGARRPAMWPEAKEGLRWVAGNPHLRAIAGCTATFNFFNTLLFAIFILYAGRQLHLSAVEVGAVFGVGSLGSVAGALYAGRLQKQLGVGRAIVAGAFVSSIAGLAVPLAPRSFPLPVLMGGQLVFGFAVVAYNIAQVSYRQAITPERLQGRMNAAMRWVVWGTMPLGDIVGGSIGQWAGLRTALWVGALGSVPAFLFVLLSSVRSIVEIPDPAPDAALEELGPETGAAMLLPDATNPL